MKRICLSLVAVTMLLILFGSIASAVIDLKGFPRDVPINLQFPCRTASGAVCPTNTNCFLTMQYPNTSVAYNNFNLSRVASSSAYYNVTLSPLSPIGDYNNVEVQCTDGILNGTESYQFTVRGAGSIPTVTEGFIYMILIFVFTLVFFLSLWGCFRIQGGNPVDADGNVINVNNLKYLKIVLVGVAYTCLLILSFFGMNISYAFSSFNLAGSIFQWMFEVLMFALKPFLCILFVYLVIKFIKDFNISKALNMGGEYHG